MTLQRDGNGQRDAQQSRGAGPSGAIVDAAAALPLHPADKRAPQPTGHNGKRKPCVRCKVEQSTVAVQTSSFCTSCFHHFFEGKVRPCIEQVRICAFIHRTEIKGESKAAKVTDKVSASKRRVALAFSGGPSSRAMLRLAKERLLPEPGQDPAKARPQEVYAIDVLYVDDSAIVPGAVDRTQEVRDLVEQEGGTAYGLHFVPLRIEDAFKHDKQVRCTSSFKETRYLADKECSAQASDSLRALFEAIRPRKTPRTALANARSRAEDMHRLLIRHILRREAKQRESSCLLTGENATRRAIRTIEGIGRGQGHKMTIEDGPSRWHDVYLTRPMADVSSKEIAFYLRSKRLEALPPVDLVAAELLEERDSSNGGGGSDSKASIGRLTEHLIQLLEGNVPGTINTVNRTNAKLIFHNDEASHLSTEGDDEGEEQEGDVMPFRHVGPSMSLRQRRMHTQRAKESDVSLTENGRSNEISELEQSVRGLGLGGQGAKLYLAANAWPRFDGEEACPLCQMPTQRGLEAWRKGLTVDKPAQIQGNEPEQIAPSNVINLSRLLCYACNLLLDTPETTPAGSTMPLPAFVLDGARSRLGL